MHALQGGHVLVCLRSPKPQWCPGQSCRPPASSLACVAMQGGARGAAGRPELHQRCGPVLNGRGVVGEQQAAAHLGAGMGAGDEAWRRGQERAWCGMLLVSMLAMACLPNPAASPPNPALRSAMAPLLTTLPPPATPAGNCDWQAPAARIHEATAGARGMPAGGWEGRGIKLAWSRGRCLPASVDRTAIPQPWSCSHESADRLSFSFCDASCPFASNGGIDRRLPARLVGVSPRNPPSSPSCSPTV